jgi:hypothetical protein
MKKEVRGNVSKIFYIVGESARITFASVAFLTYRLNDRTQHAVVGVIQSSD